jgi:choline-sulfatase
MTDAANMIFFMSDNHTRNVVGAYGHPVVRTPTLDRIAARGVRFDNAYCASPLCCASRAALATGRYPHQTGYWDNALAYDGETPSWHHRVRDSGAAVTSVGKLHFRSGENDNGFTEEIVPMHIVDGKGALMGLLRATEEGVPPRTGPREMYSRSGVGEADYQGYDRDITKHAIEWLQREGARRDRPWLLFVSYASPHPPFAVPKRLYDFYPPEAMPLPVRFTAETRPDHPAVAHIRRIDNFEEPFDEAWVRRTVAGYCGLITHTDEQIGEVMAAAEDLGLLESTRVMYTSDHGEAAGNHGLFGKSVLYEHSMGVPLIMAGPGVPEGRAVRQLASHVDLYPTLVEAMGASLEPADADLMGTSLWPAMAGGETERLGFGEFHCQSAKVGSFMLRDGDDKLIYHVGMPPQRFDLKNDPQETDDLAGEGDGRLASLEEKLRRIVDPEAVDARAKADQRAHMERHGGADAVRRRGTFNYSPVPGDDANMETFG